MLYSIIIDLLLSLSCVHNLHSAIASCDIVTVLLVVVARVCLLCYSAVIHCQLTASQWILFLVGLHGNSSWGTGCWLDCWQN